MTEKNNKTKMSNITQKWVNLLQPFSENYSAKLSASEIARRSKIPQQTVSRSLNNLTKLNLIDYVKKGKNKLFYFNLAKETTKLMLNAIEIQKSLEFQLKRKDIAIIVNEILRFSESLIIFGSYASGKPDKESDIDLVIVGKCNKKDIKKIKDRQIIEINEHYISYEEFGKMLKSKNALAREIMLNHLLLGDVSKIVGLFWSREYERM